jgi:SAM-dependent methyltransferase
MTARDRIRQIARDSIERGDPTGWFERVYAGANGDPDAISWADLEPNPHLMRWVRPRDGELRGQRALVVGCGLGDDAEALAELRMHVTAFDISPTAVNWCKRRFPASPVEYVQADATAPPRKWIGAFELVVEIYTLQTLVPPLREKALEAIAACVAPGGRLLVICRGREPSDPAGTMPWPLTKAELARLSEHGFVEEAFEDFLDGNTRRFLVIYQRD